MPEPNPYDLLQGVRASTIDPNAILQNVRQDNSQVPTSDISTLGSSGDWLSKIIPDVATAIKDMVVAPFTAAKEYKKQFDATIQMGDFDKDMNFVPKPGISQNDLDYQTALANKATSQLGESLTQPAMIAGTIAAPAIAIPAMYALQFAEGYNKSGVGEGLRQATYGPAVDIAKDPELAQKFAANPARTLANAAMAVGQVALPVKGLRRGTEIAKGKLDTKIAEEIPTIEQGKPMAQPSPDDILQQVRQSVAEQPSAVDTLANAEPIKQFSNISELLPSEQGTMKLPITQAETLELSKNLSVPKALSDTFQSVRNAFDPVQGETGNRAAEILKQGMAETANSIYTLGKSLKEGSHELDRLGTEGQYDFIDKIQSGEKQSSPILQKIADTMGTVDNQRVEKLKNMGFDVGIDNYFTQTGIWKDTLKNNEIIARWRSTQTPLQGNTGFLQERVVPDFKTGREIGLEPSGAHPVDLFLKDHANKLKFIAANEAATDFSQLGVMGKIKRGDPVPEGWIPIVDRLGGNSMWYAEPEVARLYNNMLGKGLSGHSGYRLMRDAANHLNQFQLGISAFHAGFTTLDAMVSSVGIGTMRIGQGIKTANPKMVGKGVLDIVGAPVEAAINPFRGNTFLKGVEAGGWQKKALELGGGRVTMDKVYHTGTIDNIQRAWRSKDVMGVVRRIPGAVFELPSVAVLEHLVPRQKLGIYAKMVEYELEKRPDLLSHPEIARKVLQKAWQSVDNRMGQMTYDNQFWNKTAKDLSMVTVRSVGWNEGTFLELGGGIKDIAASAGKLKTPESGYRAGYAVALPLTVGTLGAMYQYMITGKGPSELKDYFFPKNGQFDKNGDPQRISMPSYMKDVYHYYNDPKQTISNKLHPMLATIGEMLNNKDFYGTEIWHQGDNVLEKLAGHAAKSLIPFSFRGMEQQKDQPLGIKLQNFIGITPAPGSINKTAAQEMASEFLQRRMPQLKTQSEFDKNQSMQRIVLAYKSKSPDYNSIAKEEMAKGLIKPEELTKRLTDTNPPIVNQFKDLKLDEALDVYKVANPQEKAQIKETLVKKINNWMQTATPDELKTIQPKLKALKSS